MAGESGGESESLERTPTWAVATVCFVLIALSILIEHGLHLLAKYLGRKKKKSLLQALNKIKSDLMLLGFISLSLTVLEKPIATICISEDAAESFLPCQSLTSDEDEEPKCQQQGKVSLMSRAGVQQLQMLIFFLAFFHVLSSFLTFSLGIAKMKRWEYWEAETRTLEYQFSNVYDSVEDLDSLLIKLYRIRNQELTICGSKEIPVHPSNIIWKEAPSILERIHIAAPVNFLRQFFGSVYKVDYFTLRHGFIAAHFAEGSDFDFKKYLKRALEKDFELVVGMRLWIWIFSVLFIFFNAYVFRSYVWLPFIPLLMLLVVGTKLQGIITKMCLDSSDNSRVIRGTLLVKPSDRFFWFDRPKFLLHLLQFISFQNSFQLAFFTWSWYKFGLTSCFHRETEDIVIRLAMGVMIPILCGYVTLPLYALVTQMGTSMGNSAFPDGVVGGLISWRARARRNLARKKLQSPRRSSDASLESSPSLATLDASVSADLDYTSDDGFELVENVEGRNLQKEESFEGFELSRV